jgi:hypothetical protein
MASIHKGTIGNERGVVAVDHHISDDLEVTKFVEMRPAPKCSYCDCEADAHWIDGFELNVCNWCATDRVLPKLVADAIVGSRFQGMFNRHVDFPHMHVSSQLDRFLKGFWRAYALGIETASKEVVELWDVMKAEHEAARQEAVDE